MRPFNLDEYLKDPTLKVILDDGRPARIVCTDMLNPLFQMVVIVREKFGLEFPWEFSSRGYSSYVDEDDDNPKKRKRYRLMFEDDEFRGFMPYDKVLTRDGYGRPWVINYFSNFKKDGDNTIAVCLKGEYLLSNIIQFDKNKIGKIV